jgi:hypothetical protein
MGEILKKYWSENLKRIDYSEDIGVDGGNIRMGVREIVW